MINYYDKLFEPYMREGFPLSAVMGSLKDQTKAGQGVIDLVVAETMSEISQGKDFSGDCDCGTCKYKAEEYPDAKITHYMLAKTYKLMADLNEAKAIILQAKQNAILEAKQKQLVNSEKQLFEAYHGDWWQRNMPTFRKWLGFKD